MNTPPNGLQEPNGQNGPNGTNGQNGLNGTNGQNGLNGHKGNGWLSWWSLFFAVLLAGIGSYIAFVLVPSFRSPRSRVYAGILGYPSLMRLAGKPIEVEVEKARVRSLAKTISAEGHVGYLNEIPVRSEGQGIVISILAEVGQEVKKGDVLLWINTGGEATRVDELSAELREAEFKQARATLARTQTMFNARGASAQDL